MMMTRRRKNRHSLLLGLKGLLKKSLLLPSLMLRPLKNSIKTSSFLMSST